MFRVTNSTKERRVATQRHPEEEKVTSTTFNSRNDIIHECVMRVWPHLSYKFVPARDIYGEERETPSIIFDWVCYILYYEHC